jgi:hypothetical protein
MRRDAEVVMGKALLPCAAMMMFATSAFAVGADLSVGTCPGDPGVSNHATLDCALGRTLALHATFMPAEAIPDLVGLDAIVDLFADGDLSADVNFWDFESNTAGLRLSHVRPLAGCADYAATWSPVGSGEGIEFVRQSPSALRIGIFTYRPSNLSVVRDQKLYGFNLTIDASTSLESGSGTLAGCPKHTVIVLTRITPASTAGILLTPLVTPSVYGNQVVLNDEAVPTVRQTWGRLKSLYR